MNAISKTEIGQVEVNFGPREHIYLIHGNRNSHIALAVNSDRWREKTYNPFDAIEEANKITAIPAADVYLSQNGMCPFKPRCVSNVTYLNTCFVDLDTYNKPDLAELSYSERLDIVLNHTRDLPLPTLVADSGRGIYLVWVLKEPFFVGTDKGKSEAQSKLRQKFLARWQLIEDLLIRKLSNFGADPKARDPARVLRLAGSTNQRNNHIVKYTQLSDPVSFTDLELPLLRWHEREKPAPVHRPKTTSNSRNIQGVRSLFNVRTLAAARMEDLRTLSILRGGLGDHRGRALFIYAQAASYYCHDESTLVSECQQYAAEHFIDPQGKYWQERIPRHLRTLLKRFNEQSQQTEKDEPDPRYKLTNARIIQELEITEEEQAHLIAIISKDEKRRRNTIRTRDKRRANGVVPVEQYQQNRKLIQSERRTAAQQMRKQGATIKQIAEQLQRSRRTIQLLLNGTEGGEMMCLFVSYIYLVLAIFKSF